MNKEQLQKAFDKKGLSTVWKLIAPHLKNAISISLKPIKEEKLQIGQSKIGGLPDLPENITWPTFKDQAMSFIAQINLREIKAYDLDHKLPSQGMLYFFYDVKQQVWGFDPKDREGSKVFYFKGDINELERKIKPSNLDEEAFFESCQLSFTSKIDLPDYQSNLMDKLELSDADMNAYDELHREINDEDLSNKLLGHSNNIQNGMELECELVTNGIYCGDPSGYKDPKKEILEKNIDLWHLLLQIDSNDACNMMWGDVGRLYFWIRENDLKAEKFENSWVILQCC